jgi:GNAT superfamily N-acetyltransferase
MIDSNIHLREATAADSDAIVALLAELGYPSNSDEIPARLAAVTRDHGATLVAVDAADIPLGLASLARFASLHAPGPVAYITALVTSSSARRRGVGQLLVAGARAWATQHGCARLSVTSAERRADAHAFYPACGLPHTGRRFSVQL